MLIGPVELFTAIGALLLAIAFIVHLRDHR